MQLKRPSDAYRGADRILDAAGTEGRPGLREGLERLRELSGQRLVVYTTKELDGLSIREPCRVVQVAELEATIDAALAARPVEAKAEAGELREEVGKLLLNISDCYVEWGTRDEDEKEMWREDADRVIAFFRPALAALPVETSARDAEGGWTDTTARPAPAASTEGLRYIAEWSDEDKAWIASGKYPSVTCHGDSPFDAMSELQMAEKETDAALRGEGKP